VLTNGTFLNGIIHIGNKQLKGGRIAEKAVSGITEQLVEWGFESNRLKTGTPPRLDGRTIDYSKMTEQVGDTDSTGFSFLETELPQKQLSCWITYTNPKVHEVLETGFHDSPMFQGRIQGTGPRYCPSIEDKITRFASKDRHQLFVEPEGWNIVEVYLNGFSSSLPEEIQFAALRKIDGLENCKMFRPGYAIEYDYFPPTQLNSRLETKLVKNLFFAGQINGTTGYEEAACQGLIAGINAAQAVRSEKPLILGRNQAYVGVLIDDLINKGTEEPYRMFTSRAEFRTLLRQDNADLRLTELSYNLGLASNRRFDNLNQKKKEIRDLSKILKEFKGIPEQLNPFLEEHGSASVDQKISLEKLLLRPEINLENLINYFPILKSATTSFSDAAIKQVEISIKYDVYLKKEEEMVEKMISLENQLIPETFNYEKISSLSAEARQKFIKIRPATLGQASRISGVNPTDIQILTVFMGR
jgi:tRNA uridine 5-carboxymethylaminomethyl modification enzyme